MDFSNDDTFGKVLFSDSNDALFLFDPADHHLITLNPVALRLTGLTRREAQQLKVWELLSSPDPDGLSRLMNAYRQTDFFHSRESYSLKVKSGPPIAVSVSVSRIHTKPNPIGLATVRDVREARRALDGLERFFRLSPALFAILQRIEGQLHFVKVNAAWETILGRPMAEVLATPPLALSHPEDEERTREALERLERGEQTEFRHRVANSDGTYRWISWNASVSEDRIYAVGRDITDELRLQQLAVEKEAAEAASRAKSEFLALASHELRTPLTTILASEELLSLDPYIQAAPTPRLEDLHMIEQSGKHLLALIDDILDFSVIESGRLRIEPRPCSPADLVTTLVRSMRQNAEQKGLTIELAIDPAVPAEIVTDAVRVRQILYNLLGNAVSYTTEGRVQVSLAASTDSSTTQLVFQVRDTGPGIPDQVRANLFEPFSRVVRKSTHSRTGTGLGLAISRKLAKQLGGTLELEETSSAGSLFTFRLTCSPPAEPELPTPQTPGSPGPAAASHPVSLSGRILLVEDHPANQRVFALRLRHAGAHVEVADDGAMAIELILAHRNRGLPFDLVLLDMQLPVVDGYEVVRTIRGRGDTTPIIAVTANATELEEEECLRQGCDAYLSKPFEWDRLITTIRATAPGLSVGHPDAAPLP